MVRELAAIICIAALSPEACAGATAATSRRPTEQAAAKIPADQLDSLVAPIALYPDPMLSQTLVASTYPLEVIQLQQWLAQHKDLKDKGAGRSGEEAGLGPQHPGDWLRCPMSSSYWRKTSSGRRTWGMLFSRSRTT